MGFYIIYVCLSRAMREYILLCLKILFYHEFSLYMATNIQPSTSEGRLFSSPFLSLLILPSRVTCSPPPRPILSIGLVGVGTRETARLLLSIVVVRLCLGLDPLLLFGFSSWHLVWCYCGFLSLGLHAILVGRRRCHIGWSSDKRAHVNHEFIKITGTID
jgi:hypothetical protein